MAKEFDFSNFVTSSYLGEEVFEQAPELISPFPTGRTKVASLGDLGGFLRKASDTLVHVSSQDLWSLKKEADGSFYIERLFDDNGNPLKESP